MHSTMELPELSPLKTFLLYMMPVSKIISNNTTVPDTMMPIRTPRLLLLPVLAA